jgi:hypothetical protein
VEGYEADLDLDSLPHPFHAAELACPKRLNKLASSVGDEDEEKKKEFIKKLIAVIGKCALRPLLLLLSISR